MGSSLSFDSSSRPEDAKLWCAARNNNVDAITSLLANRADPNVVMFVESEDAQFASCPATAYTWALLHCDDE